MSDRQTSALILAVLVAFVIWLANAQSRTNPTRSRLSDVLDALRDGSAGAPGAPTSSPLAGGIPRIPVPILGTGNVDGIGFRKGTVEDLFKENPGWSESFKRTVRERLGLSEKGAATL